MVEALNGRAGARIALLARTPDARALERAEEDLVKARLDAETLLARRPDHFAYRSLLGQTVANLGRVALEKGNRKTAEGLLNEALDHHRIALRANPESLDDKTYELAIRRDLDSLKGRPSLPGQRSG